MLQGGGDREQSAAADRDAGGLDAMADRALNHRLAQGRLSGVGGGFDALAVQECPQGFAALQQLAAGAHRSGPGRSLSSLTAQIYHALEGGLEHQADGVTAMLELGPGEQPILPVVPVGNQLLLQIQQHGSTKYEGNDYIDGDDGNDKLLGGKGSDMIKGGWGDDATKGGEDNDVIDGELGKDTIGCSDGNDYIDGEIGHDFY